MRVLVIGATGNLGTALLHRLAEEPDVSVAGVARRPPRPGTGTPYDRVDWHAGDLAAPDAQYWLAEAMRAADAVVHFGWALQPSHDRERLRAVNVGGTRAILSAMAEAGVHRLVYASSVGTYAPSEKEPRRDEDWPATGVPGSAYSEDKVAVEAMLDVAEKADPRLAVTRLRPGLVMQRSAGAEIARYFLGPLVPVGLLRYARPPVLPRHPLLRAQVVYADDVADAVVRALRTGVTGPLNLAAEPPLDGETLARLLGAGTVPVSPRLLSRLADASWRLRLQPTDAGWVNVLVSVPIMDTTRAREELGWRPTRDAGGAVLELLGGMADGAGTASPVMRPRREGDPT